MDPSSSAARRVRAAGLCVVAVYVVSAFVSGSLSPLARRALLDGVHNAPPYNWVAQPADEQGSGQKPAAANERLRVSAQGSGEAVVFTGDQQAGLSLPEGAVPKEGTRTGVDVKIEPLDPAAYAAPPEGLVIRGNVYRVALRSVPGGAGISTLDKPGTITVTYPAPTPALLTAKHSLLFSVDGKQWRALEAEDQHAAQKIGARFIDIGYYAVSADKPDESKKAKATSSFPWILLVVLVVAVAAVFAAGTRIRRSREQARIRAQRREELARRSRSTKRKRRR